MPGTVLVRLGGGIENKLKIVFKKIQKLIRAEEKKLYPCCATFVGSDKLLNCLKGHFLCFYLTIHVPLNQGIAFQKYTNTKRQIKCIFCLLEYTSS